MPQGKKTSSKKIAEVITKKLNNPDLSLRDLERETGVPKSTSKDIIDNELWAVCTSSDTIAKMIDDNNEILNLTGGLLLGKLKQWESVRIDEIIKSRDLALKQNKLAEATNPEVEREIKVTFEI